MELQEELTATYKDKARTADELLAAGRQLQVVRESNEAQARGPPPRTGCQPRVGRRERGASPPKQPLGAPLAMQPAACSLPSLRPLQLRRAASRAPSAAARAARPGWIGLRGGRLHAPRALSACFGRDTRRKPDTGHHRHATP